jgi:hypothetical protein
MSTTTNPQTAGVANSPYILAQSAISVILLPSSSIAANGIITVGTALPTTYANAWVYLPAGAAYTGSPAGVYFAQFISTLSGTVYTNYANPATTAFTPNIPSVLGTPVAGVGAFTQTTVSQNLMQVMIPGGAMGLNGALRCYNVCTEPNNANAKTTGVSLNGVSVNFAVLTSNAGYASVPLVTNQGVMNRQLCSVHTGITSPIRTSIDTSINQPLTFAAQLSVATDYIVLEGFTIEILPA